MAPATVAIVFLALAIALPAPAAGITATNLRKILPNTVQSVISTDGNFVAFYEESSRQTMVVATNESNPIMRRLSFGYGTSMPMQFLTNGSLILATDIFSRFGNFDGAWSYQFVTVNHLGNPRAFFNTTYLGTAAAHDSRDQFIGYPLCWSPKGTRFVTVVQDGVYLNSLDGSRVRLFTPLSSQLINSCAFLTSGRSFVITQYSNQANTTTVSQLSFSKRKVTVPATWIFAGVISVGDVLPSNESLVLGTQMRVYRKTMLKTGVYPNPIVIVIDLKKGTIEPFLYRNDTVQSHSVRVSFDGRKVLLLGYGSYAKGVFTLDLPRSNRTRPPRALPPGALRRRVPIAVKRFPKERHLRNVRQLTFGGMNAEGYFAFGHNNITFQADGAPYGTACDQIYNMGFNDDRELPNQIPSRISTGLGACTCSYFLPGDSKLIFASTHLSAKPEQINDPRWGTCPPKQCLSDAAHYDPTLKMLCNTSYTWDLFPDYDIFLTDGIGGNLQRLTSTPGYDAEGAISPDGRWMVFTSMRSGDPELWLCSIPDMRQCRQLTNELGYDGGPFFSPDGTKVGFRASRPKTEDEVAKYKLLLEYHLVEPIAMELYTIFVNGTGLRKITNLGNANWAPFYLSDNRRIIFSSNQGAAAFGTFDLYVINDDGTGLEQVTFTPNGFDAFPMMSPDGRQLAWGSSRNGRGMADLNLFIADWVD